MKDDLELSISWAENPGQRSLTVSLKADLRSPEVVAAMVGWVEEHTTELAALAEAVHRIATGPEIAGHEAHFVELGMSQFEARMLAFLLPQFAAQLERQRIAERAVASYLRAITAAGSSLTISRRAQALRQECLCNETIKGALDRASISAGRNDIWPLIDRASHREEVACISLTDAASTLLKKLPKPQGRPSKVENLIHEILLFIRDDMGMRSGYTCRERPTSGGGDFIDAQTRATRDALGLMYFNPTSARRTYKKHKAHRSD